VKKEVEKVLKYGDPLVEIHHMWNVKAKVTPGFIGATRSLSRSFQEHLEHIRGVHSSRRRSFWNSTRPEKNINVALT
jgi:hypothetical protein